MLGLLSLRFTRPKLANVATSAKALTNKYKSTLIK